jgi:hypothetical protein
MQRSSDSISSLAAALAKAQIELVSPEKSLTATICSDEPSGATKTFKYAPLSSGLDIVRKTLGQHEIALVQTTSTDQAAGIINLTTVLAHSSGEWIASDWPVCPISETSTPHRMGAALTYARPPCEATIVRRAPYAQAFVERARQLIAIRRGARGGGGGELFCLNWLEHEGQRSPPSLKRTVVSARFIQQ